MSMLSVQCDELRKAAQGQKAMGLFDLAQMLNDAADTITELRGALQVASVDYRHLESENAKLRELVRDSGTCHECAGMDDVFECSACGGRYEGWALKRWARYCPDCGRRIEVDDG